MQTNRAKVDIFFRVVDETTRPVLDALCQEHLPVKIWLTTTDRSDYCVPRRIRSISSIDFESTEPDKGCYLWNAASETVERQYNGLEHLLARVTAHGTYFIVIDNCGYPCGQVVLFHDCVYDPDYPALFHKFRVFDSFEKVKEFVDSIPEKFSLNDNPRFRRTHMVVKGETVFLEPATGRQWYLDNFHNTHYEVFDKNGVHLGEADLDGNLDKSKADANKHI